MVICQPDNFFNDLYSVMKERLKFTSRKSLSFHSVSFVTRLQSDFIDIESSKQKPSRNIYRVYYVTCVKSCNHLSDICHVN